MAEHENGNGFSSRYSTIIQTVTVVSLFVAGIWAGVINPIATRLDRMLPRDEHEEFKSHIIDKIEALDAAQHRSADALVPRAEHLERWRSNDQQMQQLQKQIDDIRAQFGQSYTLADKVKELTRQLEFLQSQRQPAASASPLH